MKQVTIWINIYDMNRSYSLATVVYSQMYMLRRNGIPFKVCVLENFSDKDVDPEFRKYFRPVIPVFDWSKTDSIDESMVDKLVNMFLEYGSEINFEHDLIFQSSFLTFAKALHIVTPMKKDWFWYHWMHSAPSPHERDIQGIKKWRYTMPENSKMVYLNYTDHVMAAEMYGVMPDDVAVLPNPMDPRINDVTDETRFILDKTNLMDSEIIQIYPISLPRHTAKQVDKLIKVLDGVAEASGAETTLIVVDAHANGREAPGIKMNYHKMAKKIKLVFTSELSDDFSFGIPHKSVTELFQISDLFVYPTISEAGPLVLMEAAQAGNLIVLNLDFPPILEFYGKSLSFRFSSSRFKTQYSDEERWFKDVGRLVWGQLARSPQYWSKRHFRTKFNLDAVFREYYLPEITMLEDEI